MQNYDYVWYRQRTIGTVQEETCHTIRRVYEERVLTDCGQEFRAGEDDMGYFPADCPDDDKCGNCKWN